MAVAEWTLARTLLLAGAGGLLAAWLVRRHLPAATATWSGAQARLTLLALVLAGTGAGLAAEDTRDPILWTIPLALAAALATLRPRPAEWGHAAWLVLAPALWVARPPGGGFLPETAWLLFGTLHATLGACWFGFLALGLASADRAAFAKDFAEAAPFVVGGAALTGVFALVRADPFATATGTWAFAAKVALAAGALGLALLNARLARRGRLPWPPLLAESALVAAAIVLSAVMAHARLLG